MAQLIAGNWKMNGLLADGVARACAIHDGAAELACELVICPPAFLVHSVAAVLADSRIGLGGQDCHAEPSGAHTGDVSAPMLRDAGARWVILGHSERRAATPEGHGESDDVVHAKAVAAAAAGLTPIVCVGETAEQRTAGRETEVVGWQIAGSLPKNFAGVIAYEPVWAIGSGQAATEGDILAMHGFIRQELHRQLGAAGAGIRILYGGSVKPGNAASVLRLAEVGGALVGGASLDPEAFLAIARAAA